MIAYRQTTARSVRIAAATMGNNTNMSTKRVVASWATAVSSAHNRLNNDHERKRAEQDTSSGLPASRSRLARSSDLSSSIVPSQPTTRTMPTNFAIDDAPDAPRCGGLQVDDRHEHHQTRGDVSEDDRQEPKTDEQRRAQ